MDAIRYIFNTSGNYVAFLKEGNVFTPSCEWIGFISGGNEVYSTDGTFMGYLLDDDRIVRRRNEPIRPRLMRPLHPLRPLRPLSPLRRLRMLRLPYPYEDVFET